MHDDSVGEHLNETGQFGDGLIVRGTHLLVVDSIENSARIQRDLGERMLLPTSLMFHKSVGMTPNKYAQTYNMNVSQQIPLTPCFTFICFSSVQRFTI